MYGKEIFSNYRIDNIDTNGISKQIIKLIEETIRKSEDEVRIYAFDLTKGRCMYCDKKLYKKEIDGVISKRNDCTLEHIIPSSVLGIAVKGNVGIACFNCNSDKSSDTALDYYNHRYEKEMQVHFDNPNEFQEFLISQENIYKENWPILYQLNQSIISNGTKEIPLSLLLSAVESELPGDKVTIALPTTNTGVVERKSTPGDNSSDTQELRPWKEIVTDAIAKRNSFLPKSSKRETKSTKNTMTGKGPSMRVSTAADEVEKHLTSLGFSYDNTDRVTSEYLFSIIDRQFNLESIPTFSRKQVVKVISQSGIKLGSPMERAASKILTLLAFIHKNEELVVNSSLYLDLVGSDRKKGVITNHPEGE